MCSVNSVKATHVVGGDITYECVGTDSFLVQLQLYRDCSGVNAPSQVPVRFISSCGCFTQNLPLIGSTEISQLCPQELPNSTCNGGFLPGVELYIYEGLAILTPCADWNMSYDYCCRNSVINLPGQGAVWIEATMNSVADACNTSPRFTDFAVPYFCINQPITYDFGVMEQDGDSLVFSLIAVRSGSVNTCVITTLNQTYTLPGLIFDPITGQMTFMPTVVGNWVVVLLVEEYDPITNQLLGSVMRETQFIVMNCSNIIPNDTTGIQNLVSNTATLTGPYSLEICAGDSFAFDFCSYDLNVGDTVWLTSNVTTALPGATFAPVPGNPACAAISWVAPIQAGFYMFTIVAKDDACPVTGLNSFVITIEVFTSTYAGQDQIICQGDTAQLNVVGIAPYQWNVIAGDTSLSCTTCASPIATPDSTTTYVVTSQVVGACANLDTVTVFVIQPLNPIIFPIGPFCDNDPPVALVADTNGGIWSGPGVAGPFFDPVVAGVGTHTITYVMPNQGCPDTATIIVVVNNCPGIDEYGMVDFSIYPNPTTGVFTVANATGEEIQVYDLFGRLLLRSNEQQIDIGGFSEGIYFVRVGRAVRKLVLQGE